MVALSDNSKNRRISSSEIDHIPLDESYFEASQMNNEAWMQQMYNQRMLGMSANRSALPKSQKLLMQNASVVNDQLEASSYG